ncbi:Dinitrogenase iron-molybdenum cofactor biosynthesis protein [Desulfatibacillum aliphaticivorans]|uniref:Dinitrogenase iron-molybdenum cofactor biosynthesis protein n=1 Tax=Desulfatibacillum aliphaticivorans TaxID=218208 RepID=B8FG82_DESAL|nr:NifB/NifX family molybdenum-iron cluster-binding protein [Desulfatibacillum aliphaticivorans]ACL03762.1 Dinitrogenase iron-molybdenum cofactor biosynthesis protein [Desulfatibacillum aliphaticivorans]
MKIAVPTREGKIDDHYGHCDHFTVFTVNADKKITEESTVESPQGCGCKSNIAQQLSAEGVTVMLSGNMGQSAVDKLKEAGIQVVRGCDGDVKDVLQLWLDGEIKDSGIGCSENGHECGHQHGETHGDYTFAS